MTVAAWSQPRALAICTLLLSCGADEAGVAVASSTAALAPTQFVLPAWNADAGPDAGNNRVVHYDPFSDIEPHPNGTKPYTDVLVKLPNDYFLNATDKFDVMLLLHGGGQENTAVIGVNDWVTNAQNTGKFIFLAPQSGWKPTAGDTGWNYPQDDSGNPDAGCQVTDPVCYSDLRRLRQLALDLRNPSLNPKASGRIIIGGFSGGGVTTLHALCWQSNLWDGFAPMSHNFIVPWVLANCGLRTSGDGTTFTSNYNTNIGTFPVAYGPTSAKRPIWYQFGSQDNDAFSVALNAANRDTEPTIPSASWPSPRLVADEPEYYTVAQWLIAASGIVNTLNDDHYVQARDYIATGTCATGAICDYECINQLSAFPYTVGRSFCGSAFANNAKQKILYLQTLHKHHLAMEKLSIVEYRGLGHVVPTFSGAHTIDNLEAYFAGRCGDGYQQKGEECDGSVPAGSGASSCNSSCKLVFNAVTVSELVPGVPPSIKKYKVQATVDSAKTFCHVKGLPAFTGSSVGGISGAILNMETYRTGTVGLTWSTVSAFGAKSQLTALVCQ